MMDADADDDGLIWHVDGRVSCMEGGARRGTLVLSSCQAHDVMAGSSGVVRLVFSLVWSLVSVAVGVPRTWWYLVVQ
jgi:hypothetical protein